MIHILTVHWKDDCWVDIQLKYLHHFMTHKYKVYASLSKNIYHRNKDKFHFAEANDKVSHANKLDALVDKIPKPKPNDILIFIDGDAFPINWMYAFVKKKLKQFPLIAIQRLENLGDMQPHPCFCATRYKFWKKYNCTWTAGYRWKNDVRMVTDVGGNLLGILRKHNIKWYPMTRTNKMNTHDLFFGVYHDLIYHHGAGFRCKKDRLDSLKYGFMGPDRLTKKSTERRKMLADNDKLHEEVFNKIKTNFDFYKEFI